MENQNTSTQNKRLFEVISSEEALLAGFQAVKRNKGAPGIDEVTIEVFEENLGKELGRLQQELVSWTYEPKPVRRVEIPKPGKGAGVRLLGVPCIRYRVVQAAIKASLEPIIDQTFSENSYGFRPRRSQGQAIAAAQKIVQSGKEFVVDIDLSRFFDRIHHDRLIYRLSQLIQDKRILRLIGKILRSGVMQNGLVEETTEGAPQGGPLSPLLSNVVLDELDKELERRRLEFCRFADDCNIFVRTEKAAERVMRTITKFIETRLKLQVNQEKSKVAKSNKVKFLGMTIVYKTVAISPKALNRAMEKVKELTPRGTHQSIEQTVKAINLWYTGWANYYKMTQYPSQLAKIEAHIRRRLRSRIISQQKRRKHLFSKLMKRGIARNRAARTVFSNKGRWALSHNRTLEQAYPNRWFTNILGLKVFSTQEYPHWFNVRRLIRLI